ncbi:LytTR family DNA-binding domain-containing protein [Metallumcola ferriviriculae]|uniref:LytTR family DNA-binding domain-containing protein n=1 Tax=Metallumcola ferriviriculae TaxID=3039180 RepID=A0AAU0UN92_9FIRM|nr:LytTR family DNA-binding domain-containing protein [Desulfitibacteraceae bacterium MK1]
MSTVAIKKSDKPINSIRKKIINKLALKIERNLIFLETNDIVFISRKNRKTIIYATDGNAIYINETLENLEQRLSQETFFRSHKSYIINLDKVVEIQPWSRGSYLVIFSKTRNVAYMTADKYKKLQETLNLE